MSIRETMMKQEIEDLKSQMNMARSMIYAQIRNALISLEEGDEQECVDILRGLIGE